jgi:rare lipoprotein A
MRAYAGIVIASLGAVSLVGCAERPAGLKPAAPPQRVISTREGLASYYGRDFHGRKAASGIAFDMNAMVAAHPSYPFGTLVRVTNMANGRSIRVQIVDRGPASGPRAEGVIIDVSRRAAQALGFVRKGRARVRLDVLRWGPEP